MAAILSDVKEVVVIIQVHLPTDIISLHKLDEGFDVQDKYWVIQVKAAVSCNAWEVLGTREVR